MKYLKDNPVVLAALIVAIGLIAGEVGSALIYHYTSPFYYCITNFRIKAPICYQFLSPLVVQAVRQHRLDG